MRNICLGERKCLKGKIKGQTRTEKRRSMAQLDTVQSVFRYNCNAWQVTMQNYLWFYINFTMFLFISDYIIYVIWPAHTSTSFKFFKNTSRRCFLRVFPTCFHVGKSFNLIPGLLHILYFEILFSVYCHNCIAWYVTMQIYWYLLSSRFDICLAAHN